METKGTAVYFASDKDKQKAQLICNKIIIIIEEETEDVLFKSYIMQMLLESFEETFDVDIRHSLSVSEENTENNNKTKNGM